MVRWGFYFVLVLSAQRHAISSTSCLTTSTPNILFLPLNN